jgi:hypothetical protein
MSAAALYYYVKGERVHVTPIGDDEYVVDGVTVRESGEIIVEFKEGVDGQRLLEEWNHTILHNDHPNEFVALCPVGESTIALSARWFESGHVEWAEPNFLCLIKR